MTAAPPEGPLATPQPDSQPGHAAVGANELAQLAALVRRTVATLDSEARERLEAAWVALTSALKQPQHDTTRIGARLSRLRGEIDRLISAQLSGSGSASSPADAPRHRPD